MTSSPELDTLIDTTDPILTLSEPSQNLSTTCRKTFPGNDILIGVVVSRWDNILGPQCVYLWTEETTSCFNPSELPSHLDLLVKYVTDHTVDHHDIIENSYLLTPATFRQTLCLVPELGLAYISLLIRVPSDSNFYYNNNYYNGGGGSSSSTITGGDYTNSNFVGSDPRMFPNTVPHAVSILVNIDLLSQFMLMRPLLTNWLVEFGPKLSILLCKNQLHSSMINSWCAELCKTINTIRLCWSTLDYSIRPPTPTPVNIAQKNGPGLSQNSSKVIVRNHFEHKNLHNHYRKGKQIKKRHQRPRLSTSTKSHWEFLPPSWPSRSNFEAILTSHLSTGRSSLIVGNDIENINQMIKFLLCFSKNDESYCSRFVHSTLPDTFMKGLFVQGLVLGEIGERSVSLHHVCSNRYPLTQIEVKHKCTFKIKQTPHILNHRHRREALLIQELVNLWNCVPYVHPILEPFPKAVRDLTAKFVSKFLNDLFLLEPDKRYGRLLLFKRLIHSKAIALICYLNSIQLRPNKEKSQLIKDMKDILRVDENEYVIIQVAAEKIRPGILSKLRV